MSMYHTPVMKDQCIQYLNLHRGGTYVDATLGGGGHSLEMLKSNPEINLFSFDQDDAAIQQAGETLQDYLSPAASDVISEDQEDFRLELIHANFKDLRTELALRKIKSIDGILFDLGVSSHQIDDKSRGFSFDSECDLDMRMDRRQSRTAFEVVNELSVAELSKIFKEYGEELYARRIANAIENFRSNQKIMTTKELAAIVESSVSGNPKEVIKSKARIFQAIRIYLNDELQVLENALIDAINLLAPGGRIVVLSYHSLEDRLVKHIFRSAAKGCDCSPDALICNCNKQQKIKILTSRPMLPEESEIRINSRARSAKMRVAEGIWGITANSVMHKKDKKREKR